jgi:hypothetical protein
MKNEKERRKGKRETERKKEIRTQEKERIKRSEEKWNKVKKKGENEKKIIESGGTKKEGNTLTKKVKTERMEGRKEINKE